QREDGGPVVVEDGGIVAGREARRDGAAQVRERALVEAAPREAERGERARVDRLAAGAEVAHGPREARDPAEHRAAGGGGARRERGEHAIEERGRRARRGAIPLDRPSLDALARAGRSRRGSAR